MSNIPELFINKFTPTYFDNYKINTEPIRIIEHLFKLDPPINLMLYGPSAVGKTTILKSIMTEYSYKNEIRSDEIMYINNLKEQGIQFYRNEVKTFCKASPSKRNKKKMIIIDDFDLINEQTQQVFHSCIDDYSHNVIFILSCTTIQNVIDSIQSRFHIVKLNPITTEELNSFIHYIVDTQSMEITPEAIDFIITLSNGSIQLILHFIEKFYISNISAVTLECAHKLCNHISFYVFEQYVALLRNDNTFGAIGYVYSQTEKGYSVIDFLYTFFEFVKQTTLLSQEEKYKINELLCNYINIFHNVHENEIELALLTNNLLDVLSPNIS
jgi:DNA polymerase III gamma/tau subunit